MQFSQLADEVTSRLSGLDDVDARVRADFEAVEVSEEFLEAIVRTVTGNRTVNLPIAGFEEE